MSLTIHGTISNEKTQQGVADLVVEVLDADLFLDDFLGSTQTDELGTYVVACGDRAEIWDTPDAYLRIKTRSGRLLHSTRSRVIEDAQGEVEINVTLPPALLEEAGLAAHRDPPPRKSAFDDTGLYLNTWTFRSDADLQSAVLSEVDYDLRENDSIAALFKTYKQSLDSDPGAGNTVWSKLDALFDAGLTPESLQGHYSGVTLGLLTPQTTGFPDEFGNVLGLLWGAAMSETCPWVGKSVTVLTGEGFQDLTGSSPHSGRQYFVGVNHFTRLQTRVLDISAFQFLNYWMDLTPATEQQRLEYGWEKNGGNFIAAPADSVLADAARPVFQLNYRHKKLGNRAPNCWLIDELVQVAEEVYLGRLCYATRKLLRDYAMSPDQRIYRYAHFGYFLLFGRQWRPQVRQLFPHLAIPANAGESAARL